jgi:hypothetical protein
MTHVIKLTGTKPEEKNPSFALVKDGERKQIGKTVTLKTTGIFFGLQDYQGQESYKLKLRGLLETTNGDKEVLIDLGGSSIAKGIANALLSAQTLDRISISVYVGKESGNMGATAKDLNIESNGKQGKEDSQVLQWSITPEERATLVEKLTVKGKQVVDDLDFLKELEKRITEKFGEKYKFTSAQKPVDASLFDDDAPDNTGLPTANPSTKVEELTVEDIPF